MNNSEFVALKKSLFVFLTISLLGLLVSFMEPPQKLAGLWIFCDSELSCNDAENIEFKAFLAFDDSICYVYLGLPDGLDPEPLSSSRYELINDSLYTYENTGVFASRLEFLNDSTFKLESDSAGVSFFRRLK